MKLLYGLREKDIEKLKQLEYVDDKSIVLKDGKSVIDGVPLYAVEFTTSKVRDEAYNTIFNKGTGE